MKRGLIVSTLFVLIITACAAAPTEQPSIIVEQPTPTPRVENPTSEVAPVGPAEAAVIEQLAGNLGLKESDISIVSSEEIEFSDACLGVEMPNVVCAQVITPGHTIILEANGIQFEYHTSDDGSRIQPATPALIWKREGGIAGFCDTLTVFLSGEMYGSRCGQQAESRMGTLTSLLSSQEQKQFSDWISKFAEADLEASDPVGVSDRMIITLQFFGTGDKPPTQSDQQKLFEFAQNLYQKLSN